MGNSMSEKTLRKLNFYWYLLWQELHSLELQNGDEAQAEWMLGCNSGGETKRSLCVENSQITHVKNHKSAKAVRQAVRQDYWKSSSKLNSRRVIMTWKSIFRRCRSGLISWMIWTIKWKLVIQEELTVSGH